MSKTELAVVDPHKDKVVEEIGRRVTKYGAFADDFQVRNDKELAEGADAISRLYSDIKTVEDKRKSFTSPLRESIDRINGFFKGLSEPMVAARAVIETKMKAYQQDQERKRQEEEARLRREQLELERKEREAYEKKLAEDRAKEAEKRAIAEAAEAAARKAAAEAEEAQRKARTASAKKKADEQAAEAERLATEAKKREAEAAKASEKVDTALPAPLPQPAVIVAAAPKTIVGKSGGAVNSRTIKKWRICVMHGTEANGACQSCVANFENVPNTYKTLDTAKIEAAKRAGIAIPGIEVFEDTSYASR